MKKQINITYNEHCAVLDALERIENDMEHKRHKMNADALITDADYQRERATRRYLAALAAKWNAVQ
jgi:uncharacterized short protein YbdD (DUF466 family)